MDRKEFMNYLELYGGDLGRWPAGLREAAEAAFSSSQELRLALEEERHFEETLMERAYEEPSPGLEARIISAAAATERPERTGKSLLGMLGSIFSAIPLPRPAIALPLLLVIGMAAGYFFANYSDNDTDSSLYSQMMYYGEGYYE